MLRGLLTDTNPLTGKTTYYKTLFFAIMSVSVAVMLGSLWITDGESARWFLFVGGDVEYNSDTFMDFFNSIVNTYNNPYDAKVIYPAICSLIFRLLLKMVRPADFDAIVTEPNKSAQEPQLKLYQSFMLTYVIFSVIVVVLFFLALGALMKNRCNGEKALVALFCMLSAPFLFLIDRGNILVLSLVFAMLFVAYYDHKCRWVRELALICLAFSISIKIYPVVFAVLLLNEKRYKELIRAAIYTLIVFFLPFVFFGGLDGAIQFVKNLTSTSSNGSLGINRQLSFQKLPLWIGRLFNSRAGYWAVIGKAVLVVFSAVGAFSLIVSKNRWKACAICACMIAGVPSMSSRYTLTFFIIPIILLLMEQKENDRLSYVSLVIMSGILFVKPIQIWGWSAANRYLGYKIDTVLYVALFIILCVDAIIHFVKRVKSKNEADRCAQGK
ncbi:MAG: DUF2029 domain-containing protein [Clostridia bacterium]|nr:DUF2029 domain-containing protein [Clostridia bacterium]